MHAPANPREGRQLVLSKAVSVLTTEQSLMVDRVQPTQSPGQRVSTPRIKVGDRISQPGSVVPQINRVSKKRSVVVLGKAQIDPARRAPQPRV